VKKAVFKGGVHVALGPNDISPLFLRHAPEDFFPLLTDVLNFSWSFSSVPTAWKRAHVTPLFKHSGDRRVRSNYRPISLTSIVAKVLERCVHARLWQLVKKRISAKQAGFRPHFSTHDAIFRVQSAIFDALERNDPAAANRYLSVAFLDISRAFDAVWHVGLIAKLARMDVPVQMCRWIRAFISGRQLSVVHANCASDWFSTSAGVPQGCILSPILFLIFINDITTKLSNCDAELFADDIAVWSEAHVGLVADEDLNHTLEGFSDWALLWKVTFSASKSKFVAFFKKGSRPGKLKISLDGHGNFPIPREDHFKYLGSRFSEDCRWSDHQNKLAGSAVGICSLIARHTNKLCPSPTIVRTLITALVLPVIMYSMPFWEPSATFAARLDSLICWPLRKVLGLSRSSHGVSLLAEFGLLPVSKQWDLSVLRFGDRARNLEARNPTQSIYKIQFHDESKRAHLRHTAGRVGAGIYAKYNLRWYDGLKIATKAVHSAFLREWKADTKSSKLLKSIRSDCSFADYLSLDSPSAIIRRASFRHNRVATNRHLFLRGEAKSEACNFCDCPSETISHLLLDCPAYKFARHRCELALNAACMCSDNPFVVPFSLAFILGELPAELSTKSKRELLAISDCFLARVCSLRARR
jgi:hypothetical protein